MKNIYRNYFHIEPERGLLNDPNGLIHFKGTYYFFHQWNRFNTNHDYKEWGLFTSNDLIHWQQNGSALLPDSFDDKDGVYSGSAVENEGKLYIFYTGNTKTNDIRKSYQKIAISEDGQTFIKQQAVIETPKGFSENHRDPKVWKNGNFWWMIVGGQTTENQGAISLFKSLDLRQWEFQGMFYTDPQLDQMCECPDYFPLTENIDILMVCPQKRTHFRETDIGISSYSGYLIGKFNEENCHYMSNAKIEKTDIGFDFYAPQTFQDAQGRRIIVAWMSRMSDQEEAECPTVQDGYLHCLTMPRELVWKNNRLYQLPLSEYLDRRNPRKEYDYKEDEIENEDRAYAIDIDFKEEIKDFEMQLNSKSTFIRYSGKQLEIGRINWVTQMNESKTFMIEKLHKLQIFCDSSTMEIFINDGEYVFSMRYFTNETQRNISYRGLDNDSLIRFYHYNLPQIEIN